MKIGVKNETVGELVRIKCKINALIRRYIRGKKGKGYWDLSEPRKVVGVGGETSLCRERLIRYCVGRGIDIGCGRDKIRPKAVGFDKEDGDAQVLSRYGDEEFDYVYSSHCLEDIKNTKPTLKEWTRILKKGGYLVLYLPHADYYPNIGYGGNPSHKHDFYPEDIIKIMRKIGDFNIVHLGEYGPAWEVGEWSFEIVFQKIR